MVAEVAGVKLDRFTDPIHAVLSDFSETSDGRVVFDTDQAARLELTGDDKGYSASSTSNVLYEGKPAGKLHVLAFAPFDATGNETTYKIGEIKAGYYYGDTKFLPRSKETTEAELNLSIAVAPKDEPNKDPVMYAGNLSLLGFSQTEELRTIATLGQGNIEFLGNAWEDGPGHPIATYTVGYSAENSEGQLVYDREGRRFGDPHAVYNPWKQMIQVCGFLAVDRSKASDLMNMLSSLEPVVPVINDSSLARAENPSKLTAK
jgi:hypothetical protein